MDELTSPAAVARALTAVIDRRDWSGLEALLSPDFTATLLHTGERFDRDAYVRFNADYPGTWSFLGDEVVAGDDRVVLRAHTTDGTETYHVALFLSVVSGLVTESVEVWTEAVRAVDRSAAPSATGHQHHTIDYVELDVADLPATRAFYEQAFGWEFNEYGPGYAGIRSTDGRGEAGGLNGAPEARPGAPLVLLFSTDLDATVEAIVTAGGRVVNGPYGFPGGRRLHFTDPAGNELGVWAEAPEG